MSGRWFILTLLIGFGAGLGTSGSVVILTGNTLAGSVAGLAISLACAVTAFIWAWRDRGDR